MATKSHQADGKWPYHVGSPLVPSSALRENSDVVTPTRSMESDEDSPVFSVNSSSPMCPTLIHEAVREMQCSVDECWTQEPSSGQADPFPRHWQERCRSGNGLGENSPSWMGHTPSSLRPCDVTNSTRVVGGIFPERQNMAHNAFSGNSHPRKRERVPDTREANKDLKQKRANERERQYNKRMNDALHKLRNVVPAPSSDKLSKLGTLQLAIRYISVLEETLHAEE